MWNEREIGWIGCGEVCVMCFFFKEEEGIRDRPLFFQAGDGNRKFDLSRGDGNV